MFVRISRIYTLGDGRQKCEVAILKPGKNIKLISATVWGSVHDNNDEIMEQKTQEALVALALKNADTIIDCFKRTPKTEFTLGTYAFLRWERIRVKGKWAGQASEFQKMFENELLVPFGVIDLLQCTSDLFLERMDVLTGRKRKKTAMEEWERRAWILLSDILSCAWEEKCLSFNPDIIKKIANKCKNQLSTQASKYMARQNLSMEEVRNLLDLCDKKETESDAYPAMRIQLLSGLTVNQLMGLSIGDFQSNKLVKWIQVERELVQKKRGGPAELTELLGSPYAYRRVPVTEVLEKLIMRQIMMQRQRGYAKKTDPLFLNEKGERLRPDEYKRAVNQTLAACVYAGAHLPFRKRGSRLPGGADKPTLAANDFLRKTAGYFYRNICGLTEADCSAVLGMNHTLTYGGYYVDWNNDLVLMYLSSEMNRWHMLLYPPKTADEKIPGMYHIQIFEGTVSADSVFRAQSDYGICGVIFKH